MLHIVVVMIFPCRFCLVSRWFAWLGGGLTSLKLGTLGVLGIGPCAQLLPNLSHALLTLAVCKGGSRLWGPFPWWEGEGSHPLFVSPGPMAQVLLERHLLPLSLRKMLRPRKVTDCLSPQTHIC